MQEFLELKEQELSTFLDKMESSLHSRLFPEEYDHMYDSSSEAYSRQYEGKNPKQSQYIEEVNNQRIGYNVSPLGQDGMPIDNSSELYVRKLINEWLSKKTNRNNRENKKMNISSFFKNQIV